MCYILNIETATTVCSVSISRNNELIAYRELDKGYTHAENLHLFIQEILKETQLKPAALNAIAVSKGPGSYTGLRIGASTAKGLAYALKIPLISIDTLQVMTAAALSVQKKSTAFYCPMIDARRMEVYTAVYDPALHPVLPVEALIVDENSRIKFESYSSICFFGDGMEKCKAFLSAANSEFIDGIAPSARHMPSLSFRKFQENNFEDTAYFEPFYLKDFMIKQKKLV